MLSSVIGGFLAGLGSATAALLGAIAAVGGPAPVTLPQTPARPSSNTRVFVFEMDALWRAVQLDSVQDGLPAFFPEGAYAQIKAIADPRGDWLDRLVGEFRLDIAAAHALLGASARRDRLVRVEVPPEFAHWIPPEVCYNSAGYWETPNSRIVYSQNGQLRSFGIASMISWRGVWYVVHLGAILRSDAGGEVDAPAVGPGTPVPSSTC